MNKRQKMILDSYNQSRMTNLNDAYYRCSDEKRRAYSNCLAVQYLMGGHDGRITGANTFHFSYAFKYEDKETKKESICYITHVNKYTFCIQDETA